MEPSGHHVNCPFSLAAGLARATADDILQGDLSVYHLNKTVEEGTDPFPQLESVKLARLVFNKLCETCCLWLKDFPHRRRQHRYYETSIHAIKNMRRKMEDKHVVIPDFNTLFNLQHLRCGTTGVVTFLRGTTLHVAWLGDSQSQRSLSVSRAIGDSEHKPYICGDADHSRFPLDGTEDYLILACDGFYDTVSPDEAVRVVSDHLQENSGDSTMVAHKLVASARDAGSSDNITVIVVFLRDPRAPPATPEDGEEEEGEREEEAADGRAEEAEEDGEEEEEEEVEARRAAGLPGRRHGRRGQRSGSWPLQQCSAPADLGYEDRMDSFTDRTSLSLQGPSLASEESWLRLPPPAHPPKTLAPGPAHAPARGPGAAWRPPREEGERPAHRHGSRGPNRSCPPAGRGPAREGHWPEAAALFSRGRRPRRGGGRVPAVGPRPGGAGASGSPAASRAGPASRPTPAAAREEGGRGRGPVPQSSSD
ncbi:hypothetical protein ANANG_G00162780 [Anguilla anguilla]|uniref:PPM-type phosphatase domain-containing protein n=1 Tax=Anguilla anguilla TaxID=7936 RepID=A0A9D3MAG6_ANGAN|nr:hypothetical protein ANANG_G00162780 [Anguilla anguilla]